LLFCRPHSGPGVSSRASLPINFGELTKHFESVQQLHGKMVRAQRSEAVVSRAMAILDLSDDEADAAEN
jgi:hypothetical protein